MSFLKRRKSGRRAAVTDSFHTDSGFDDCSQSSRAPSVKSTSDIKKRLSSLSSLLSRSSRSQPSQPQVTSSGGVAFIATPISNYTFEDSSLTPSPEPSLEIRRPSGLGRRASLSDEFSAERPGLRRDAEQKPKFSVPDLVLFPNGLVRWVELSDEEDDDGEITPEPLRVFDRVPLELLNTLFSFIDRASLVSLAQVCKRFLEPARISLYKDIDFSNDTGVCFNSCMNLLASRRDFAQLVRGLMCTSAPSSKNSDGSVSLPAVTFAIALNNMTELTSLTLPRYDAPILFHTAFRLKKLCFTCDTVAVDELRDTFAWISSQPTITSLSFPNLVLDRDSEHLLAGASSLNDSTIEQCCKECSTTPNTPPPFAFSRDFLPHLTHLNGPISLVSALTPGRPLESLTIRIHNTIYKGLRPSALMGELALSSTPITHIFVVTSLRERVDARTFERVLMSIGTELGAHLKCMEIESTLDDGILYKHLLLALSRYRSLHTLRLSRSSTPIPAPFSGASPKSGPVSPVALPTPPITAIRPRADTALTLKNLERATLGAWSKHCPTLRSVLFPSFGKWRISQGVTAPIYTFTGYASG